MIIKRGNVVSHAVAVQWGIGKVVEVATSKVTIEFADGTVRKIDSSHYASLLQADPALYLPIPPIVPAVKVRATAVRAKKLKATAP